MSEDVHPPLVDINDATPRNTPPLRRIRYLKSPDEEVMLVAYMEEEIMAKFLAEHAVSVKDREK